MAFHASIHSRTGSFATPDPPPKRWEYPPSSQPRRTDPIHPPQKHTRMLDQRVDLRAGRPDVPQVARSRRCAVVDRSGNDLALGWGEPRTTGAAEDGHG